MNTFKLTRAVTDIIREQLTLQKQIRLRVISNSMAPVIYADDEIIIESIQVAKLMPGDIIMFDRGADYCTHRFVIRLKNGFGTRVVTKGDQLSSFDTPFSECRVIGKVKEIHSKKKRIDLCRKDYRLFHLIYGRVLQFQWRLMMTILQPARRGIAHAICRRLFFVTNRCFSNLIYFRV